MPERIVYKCIKSFMVEKYVDSSSTEEYNMVTEGSLWELNNSYSLIGGENHLDCLDEVCGDLSWLELSNETVAEYFERLEKEEVEEEFS